MAGSSRRHPGCTTRCCRRFSKQRRRRRPPGSGSASTRSFPQPAHPAERIWIHAVSAGKSKVAELLRQRAARRATPSSPSSSPRPPIPAMRASAAPPARRRASSCRSIRSKRSAAIFETVRPDLLVLVESEYWPAQFAAAAKRPGAGRRGQRDPLRRAPSTATGAFRRRRPHHARGRPHLPQDEATPLRYARHWACRANGSRWPAT